MARVANIGCLGHACRKCHHLVEHYAMTNASCVACGIFFNARTKIENRRICPRCAKQGMVKAICPRCRISHEAASKWTYCPVCAPLCRTDDTPGVALHLRRTGTKARE